MMVLAMDVNKGVMSDRILALETRSSTTKMRASMFIVVVAAHASRTIGRAMDLNSSTSGARLMLR